MQLTDITDSQIIVAMNEHEARLLAIACLTGAYEVDGSGPTTSPFAGYADKTVLYAALESWQALFEAAACAAYAISEAPVQQQPGLTLSALRQYPPDNYSDIGPEERAAKVTGEHANGGAA